MRARRCQTVEEFLLGRQARYSRYIACLSVSPFAVPVGTGTLLLLL